MKTFSRLGIGAILIFSGGTFAHEGATGIVKERMDLMSSIADGSKLVGDMLKGKREMDFAAIINAAQLNQNHAARIPELFPDSEESRKGHKTEALPVIWERWSEFESLAKKLEEESARLAELAETANKQAIRKQFLKVAKSCRGCHSDFRKPKD